MQKTLITLASSALLSVIVQPVFSEPIPSTFYNVASGQCRMLNLYIGSVAGWRDNGVPIERVQENVQTAVSPFGLTPEVLLRWRRAVDEIYYSTQTQEQVSAKYEGFCAPYERMNIPVPMPR